MFRLAVYWESFKSFEPIFDGVINLMTETFLILKIDLKQIPPQDIF